MMMMMMDVDVPPWHGMGSPGCFVGQYDMMKSI